MKTISYGITVCNELIEVQGLISQIQKYKRPIDDIIVLFDSKNGSKEVHEYLFEQEGITLVISDEFNRDFAKWKNKIFDYSKKDHIFFLDADEMVTPILLDYIPEVIDYNQDVDVVWIPRINTVEGITEEYIKSQGWRIDHKNRINYPDMQGRICKNIPELRWKGAVHETIQGGMIYSHLPSEEFLALKHFKSFEKQIKQNELYSKI